MSQPLFYDMIQLSPTSTRKGAKVHLNELSSNGGFAAQLRPLKVKAIFEDRASGIKLSRLHTAHMNGIVDGYPSKPVLLHFRSNLNAHEHLSWQPAQPL
jgi:hypothetical protein